VSSVEERRRFERIRFSEDGIHFSEDEGIFGIFKTLELSISLSINEISKGGLKLALPKDQANAFRKGDILILSEIKGTANIEFDDGIGLEIKWMQDSDKSGYVVVGCEFKEMSENTREQINQFVNCEMRWKGMRRKDMYETDNEPAGLQEVYTISKRKLKMMISGLGIVVLSISLFFMLLKGNKESPSVSLESFENRICMLEKVLKQQKTLDKSITFLRKHLQELEEDIGSLAFEIEAKQHQNNAPAAPVVQRHHKVQQGENLYRIALKYEISVDDLCNLNGISTDQFIQPGQKLAVP
jgi:LysM repeat protein